MHKAEALLRWRDPVRGLLVPAEFLPFAESNGLIVEIGDWVFREAARQVQQWQREIDPQFQVSVNKSPLQFQRDAALYQQWLAFLAGLRLPAQSIVVELGESALLEGAAQVAQRLQEYRSMGLQVALDHFGTGYSSLSHLKRYDIDYVKIDQWFANTIENDAGDPAMCEAIIGVANAGCDYAQGFLLGGPMTAQELEAMARGES